MNKLNIDEIDEILYCVNKERRHLGELTTPTTFTQHAITVLDSAEQKLREAIAALSKNHAKQRTK